MATNYSSGSQNSHNTQFKPRLTRDVLRKHSQKQAMSETGRSVGGSQYSYPTNSGISTHTTPNYNQAIENTFQKWNQYENHVEVIERKQKKEMMDRLRDFDPPAMVNSKGQDIYKARADAKRKKIEVKQKRKEKVQAYHNNIQKMQELYGLKTEEQK